MPLLLTDSALDRLPRARTRSLASGRERHVDLLLARAQHLKPDDERLIRLAHKHQLTARQIAPLVGRNHGSVVRRLGRLEARLTDPAIVALIDAPGPLSPTDRRIALAHYLRCMPLRQLARDVQLPLVEVRRRLQYVKGWLTGRRDGVRTARAILQPS